MASDEASPELTDLAHKTMPFMRLLGLEVLHADAERVSVRGRWDAERCTSNGMLHGGYLMAAVDSAGAMCAFYNLPEGATGTSTIESKTNFFAAVRSGQVAIEAKPLHVGRSVIVVQTDATDENGRHVSRSLQTQTVLYPRAKGS
ncbi:MAG: PaaI family thioesterase [Dehalococcoidia bacterium]